MAMLLAEEPQRPTAPRPTDNNNNNNARELIVTTNTPWKWGDEENERAANAAHRAWVKSGAAACAGMAASRWYKQEEAKVKVTPQNKAKVAAAATARSGRVSYTYIKSEKKKKKSAAPASCTGLAASRWYAA